jgi:carbonic anhydrase/acetyltransferase-like protein (isoleucine patch superfamily)
VQSGSIVAAGAVVLMNAIVESGYIYAGVPAKKLKTVGDLGNVFERTSKNYIMYSGWYQEE